MLKSIREYFHSGNWKNNMLWIKLAWRNIWRNWRRSVLTILAIFFAALLSVVSRSAQLGTYAVNIKHTIEMFTGYFQIQNQGYLDNPKLTNSFRLTPQLKELLDSNKNIKSYSERISGSGLISYKQNTIGVFLLGISTEQEARTTKIKGRIKSGTFLDINKSNGIIVGRDLIKNLKAKLGDTIVVLAPGADGTMGNMKFVILGTYSLGSSDFDANSAMINLKTADTLLSMYGKMHIIAVKLKDPNDISSTVDYINSNTSDKKIVAIPWEKVLPELKQSIELDNVSGLIMYFLLMVVVAFGILNTVLMSINERYKEFGIMLALGVKNTRLLQIVFLEVLFLILLGIITGNAVALSINYYLYNNPIYVSGDFAELYEMFGFLPAYYFSLEPGLYINISLSIVVISLLSFIYPAYKIIKLEPLKGIRYT